jgi:hypothetical protein
LFISNLYNGIDIYNLSTLQQISNVEMKIAPGRNFLQQVASDPDGRHFVCGGDSGCAYLVNLEVPVTNLPEIYRLHVETPEKGMSLLLVTSNLTKRVP